MAPSRKVNGANGGVSGPPLYFSVIYADNRTAMFNIACQKEHLISAIHRRCQIDKQVVIELCTTRGELLKLPDRCDQDWLSDVIRSRDVLVLCKLEASKFPGIGPRLVPLVTDLLGYPALKQLAESIDQRVTESELRLTQKQQPAASKKAATPQPTSTRRPSLTQLQQQLLSSDGAPVGLTKGRIAVRKIMLINKMTKR